MLQQGRCDAMDTLLAVNLVFENINEPDGEGRFERVLWIAPSGEDFVSIALDEKNPFPIWRKRKDFEEGLVDNRLRICKIFVSQKEFSQVNTSSKHLERRDEAWNTIQSLVEDEPAIYFKENRGSKITKIAKEFNKHPMTIYKYLRKYWQGGKSLNALLPNYFSCGGPGKERAVTDGLKRGRPSKLNQVLNEVVGINIDEEIKRKFDLAYRKFHVTEKLSLKHTHEKMLAQYFNVGFRQDGNSFVPVLPPATEMPTYEQFLYWIDKMFSTKEKLIGNKGEKRYNLNSRELLGNSTEMAFGPGSIFQIDATPGDVYLVSNIDKKSIIGRPTVYVLIDVFSRLIVGLYVGIEEASWLAAMIAMCNAASDKVEYCKEYEIEITPNMWPSRYLPKAIIADRGEVEGKNANPLVLNLGVRISNTPPYRADWKGIVERCFGMIRQNTVYRLPGAVKEKTRGDHDYRLDACLTEYEFTQIMIKTVLEYNLNHRMEWYPMREFLIENDVKPIPIELWTWGILHRNGNLKDIPLDIVKLNLLPRGEGAVTESGIRFKKIDYTCKTALQKQWFIQARNGRRWKVPIAYDPRNMTKIYLIDENGRDYDVCELLNTYRHFKNCRVEEVEAYYESKSIDKKEHQSRELQSRTNLTSFIEDITSKAKERKNQTSSSESKAKQLKNIKENRRMEKIENRKTQAWDLSLEQAKETKITNGEIIPFTGNINDTKKSYQPKKMQELEYLWLLRLQREAEDDE